jgi:hypothetical protein
METQALAATHTSQAITTRNSHALRAGVPSVAALAVFLMIPSPGYAQVCATTPTAVGPVCSGPPACTTTVNGKTVKGTCTNIKYGFPVMNRCDCVPTTSSKPSGGEG